MKRIVTIIFCSVLCVFGQKQPNVPEGISPESKETLDDILDFMACVDEGKCDPRQQNIIPETRQADEHVQGWKHAILSEDVTIPEARPKHTVFVESVEDLQREVPNEDFPIPGKPSNPVFVENVQGLNHEVPSEHVTKPEEPINPVFVQNIDGLHHEVPDEHVSMPGKPTNPVIVENVDGLHKVAPNVQVIRPGKPSYPEFEENAQDFNREVPKEHVAIPGKQSYPIRSPYFSLCEKFHLKMSELERGHEELKSLKFQFLERLNYYTSSISTECQKGESIVIKVLDLIIYVAEKMKKEYGYLTHDEYNPIEEPDNHLNPGFVGSYRGIPGVHYPNYTEVPITSFSCSGRRIPGFYVDLETRCQVFHVCYEHRMESFLCPLGTIFNQALLVCDYWYSSTCSDEIHVDLDTDYNEVISVDNTQTISEETGSSVDTDTIVGGSEEELKTIVKFLPVKAKILEFPKGLKGKPIVSSIDDVKEVANKILDGIVTSSKGIVSTTAEAIEKFPKSKTLTRPVKPSDPQVHSKVWKSSGPQVVKVLPKESKVKHIVSSIDGVEEVADKIFSGIVTTGTKVASKTRKAIEILPEPKVVKHPEPQVVPVLPKVKIPEPHVMPVVPKVVKLPKPQPVQVLPKVLLPVPKPFKVPGGFPKMKPLPLAEVKSLKLKVTPWIKLKMVAAGALPTTKAHKVTAVPIAKAKVASAKVPLKAKIVATPFAKTKFAKASVPFYKVKAIPTAAAKPVAKTKLVKSKLAAAVPVVKVKKTAKAVLPISKVAVVKPKLVVPSVKAKLVKSIVLSPLTKKALAIGYLKLLKAKKLGLVF